jgi:hypothetical protein
MISIEHFLAEPKRGMEREIKKRLYIMCSVSIRNPYICLLNLQNIRGLEQ